MAPMCPSALIRIPLFICLCGLAFGSAGCTDTDSGKTGSAKAGWHKPDRPDEKGVPKLQPIGAAPTGREGDQVPEEELEKILADAAAAEDHSNERRRLLVRCANKIPASARCDGQLGLELITNKKRRDVALYYLMEAARVDDPKASASLYGDIGEQLRLHAKLEDAASALIMAADREDTVERHRALASVLQSIPERRTEAADELAWIRNKGDSNRLLLEEAVIRGQVADQLDLSLQLFKEYAERTKDLDPGEFAMDRADLKVRIGELEGMINARDAAGHKPKQ